jgi:hypothetical protein
MGRYAMWQLDLANDLFIAKAATLGKSEICYNAETEIWEYNADDDNDSEDGHYSCSDSDVNTEDSDSDLEAFTLEDDQLCVYVGDQARSNGKRQRV